MSNEIALQLNSSGLIGAASGPIQELFGCTREAFVGKHLMDLVNANDHERLRAIVSFDPFAATTGEHGIAVRLVDERNRSTWAAFLREPDSVAPDEWPHRVTFRLYVPIERGAFVLGENIRAHEAIVQESADVVMVIEPNGTVQFANPAMLKIFGLAPDELIGTQLLELIHESDHDVLTKLVAALLEDASVPRRVEFRVRHVDGTYRWIDGWVQNLLDHPEVGAMLGTGRDVTERHRAEEALAASEERFRSLTASSPSAIFELDDDAKVRFANEKWLEVTGRSVSEVTDVFAVLLGEDATMLRALWNSEFLKEGLDERVRVVRRDGALRWVELRTRPVHDADGRITAHVGTLHDVTDIETAHRKLEHLASHDPLTGLPNRAMLLDRLRSAVEASHSTDESLALLFVDLDHFKVVNDSLGHHAGDRVLVEVAQRLLELVRPDDVVARFGGDEFVILCAPVSSQEQTVALADRIRQRVSGGVNVDGELVHVSVSVGVVMGSESVTPEAMLRDADSAMYAAKGAGRDRAQVFDDDMHRAAMERLTVEAGLRQAVERDEFLLTYQPIVDVNTACTAGVEVLLRWDHPVRGLLPPDDFMDVVEEIGLLGGLGNWVLEQACAEATRWTTFVESPPTLFVNLATAQLVDPRLVETVARVIETTGINPNRLVLEVTERMLMTSPEAIAVKLAAVRELGVRIAIDDFGTGYSSLAYLTRLPVDVLKIDSSFVHELADNDANRQVAAAVISLAHALGLDAVAEGVEFADQGEVLRELDCDLIQGFFYAEPVSADQLVHFFNRPLPLDSAGE